MRLTRAGVGLLVVAIGCFATGRIFGTDELFYLAAISAVALVIAMAYTLATRLELGVARSATPSRLRAGAPARIDIELTNTGRRATPVLHLRDQVQSLTGASVMMAPIRRGGSSRVAYRLPTRRRGRLVVGPLDLTMSDPLGLTTSTLRASDHLALMVHAQLVDLAVLHAVAGNDPTADQQPIRTLASGGDEFFALRPYVVGDELRRVHWRASAKTGDLVVKQEERPRTGRITVMLDTRREVYDEDGFERAVSAALSALHSGFRGDDALRFVTSTNPGYTDIRSRGELDAIDEQLAMIATTEHASLVRGLDDLAKGGRGGTLVVITGVAARELPAALEKAGRSFGTVIPVVCQPVDRVDLGLRTVLHDGESDFVQSWANSVRLDRAGSR